MPDYVCPECHKHIFHENETTLNVQKNIHSKFCRKTLGETHSFMHRDLEHMGTFDAERENDSSGTPILKK